jgi:hypothetical protein
VEWENFINNTLQKVTVVLAGRPESSGVISDKSTYLSLFQNVDAGPETHPAS